MQRWFALVPGLLWCAASLADDPAPQPAASTSASSTQTTGVIPPALAKPKAGNKSPAFTPEREAAALAFVQANHPELAAVLTQLKGMQRAQYENAIRDLFRVSEELAKAKEQDPQRYAVELQVWQTKSRVQLLAARASISDDPALEAELRAALERQTDAQKAQLAAQRDQAAERLKKLDDSLANLERDRKKQVDKQLAGIMRDARRHNAANKKTNKKPAAAKTPIENKTVDSKTTDKPPTETPAAAEPGTKP